MWVRRTERGASEPRRPPLRGVGDRRKPPLYLFPGDKVDVEIDGIGLLENTVQQGE